MRRLILAAAAALAFVPHSTAAQERSVIEVVELEGVIEPRMADYLSDQLRASIHGGAGALVVQLDTPGGLRIPLRTLTEAIARSPVPVIVWVGPPGSRAASAGVFLLYASHVSAMAPGTVLGPGRPPDLGSSAGASPDATALLTGLASARHRDPAFARSTLSEGASIEAGEARDRGIVDLVPVSLPDLLERLDGRRVTTATGTRTLDTAGQGVEIRFHQPGLVARILRSVTSPTAALVLLLLGLAAIVFELSQPGLGVAGFAGAAALGLAGYALAVVPLNLFGLALVLLGVALPTLDVLTNRLGVLTAGGTVALAAGSVLLFSGVAPAIRVSPWLIGGLVLGNLLFYGFGMTVAMRARRQRIEAGQEGLVGLRGVTRDALAPDGQVEVKGTVWRARALNGPLEAGTPIRVRRVDGLLLLVEAAPEAAG